MGKFWGEIEGPSMQRAEELTASIQGLREFGRFKDQSDEDLDSTVEGVMLLQSEESRKGLDFKLSKMRDELSSEEEDPDREIKQRIIDAFERHQNKEA